MPAGVINVIALVMALLSAVPIILSVRYIVKMFDVFGSGLGPAEQQAEVRQIRNKMFVCYALAAGLIAGAALVKIFLT